MKKLPCSNFSLTTVFRAQLDGQVCIQSSAHGTRAALRHFIASPPETFWRTTGPRAPKFITPTNF